ncbi:MAG: GlmU family protein [Flavobacteriales bacterium]|nr:GlmU family protein [Flavobacteriales bacterium]
MHTVILFDDPIIRRHLLPFTYTRPVADIRTGILTIRQRWEHFLQEPTATVTESYLQTKFPSASAPLILAIASQVIASSQLVEFLMSAKEQTNVLFFSLDTCVGGWITEDRWEDFITQRYDIFARKELSFPVKQLKRTWEIFSRCGEEIQTDFEILTTGRTSQHLPAGNILIGPADRLFIEQGAVIQASVINTTGGPVYIARDAEVMEGTLIRGPFSLGEHSQTKLGAKIYGPTTLGPYVKVGGELNNVVIFGYSNKAHDGFLGNAVIGEWCNIGADSNNSNLKNNYAPVKLWSYVSNRFENTGLQFCGLIMGDHSKCGINTMFNTGTVVGVSANIFGPGFPRNFIPSFVWGGALGFTTYKLADAIETAQRVYQRRNLTFDAIEQAVFEAVFEQSAAYRTNLK